MANPQKEDGHVDIANEIMEALAKTRIPGEARQVLDFILRKTYGWHKKQDSISLTQFQGATYLKRNQVCRAIKKLIAMNLIIKGSDNTVTPGSDNTVSTISTYEFQKDFDKWMSSYNPVTSDKSVTGGGYKTYKKVVTKVSPTKETIQKKTIQKKEIYSEPFLNWYSFYPKKSGKMAAFREWKKASPNMEDLITAIKIQIEYKIDLQRQGKFCPEWPDPERWIKNRRWEDEPINIPKDKSEPRRVQCDWCKEIYPVNKDHQCKEE